MSAFNEIREVMEAPWSQDELLSELKEAVTESDQPMTELRSTDFRNEGMNLRANEEVYEQV